MNKQTDEGYSRSPFRLKRSEWHLIIKIQCDQKVSVYLMITIQEVTRTSNVQSVPLQSPDIY